MIQSTNFGSTLTGVDEKTGAAFSRTQAQGADFNTMFQTAGLQALTAANDTQAVAAYMNLYAQGLAIQTAGRSAPPLPAKPLKHVVGDGYVNADQSVAPGDIVQVPWVPALPDLPAPTPPANPGGSPIPTSPTPDPIVNLQNSVNVLQNEMKALLAHFGITG